MGRSFSATSATLVDADEIALSRGRTRSLSRSRRSEFLSEPGDAAVLHSQFAIQRLKRISPVLPVLSRRDMRVPVHHLRGDAAPGQRA